MQSRSFISQTRLKVILFTEIINKFPLSLELCSSDLEKCFHIRHSKVSYFIPVLTEMRVIVRKVRFNTMKVAFSQSYINEN